MAAPARRTKTEQRILKSLYRLQIQANQGGQMGTYEWLMHETFASRPAILRTCQRLVREGSIVRRKINAIDRKRWGHLWPKGFARRQVHFVLSQEMMKVMEAEDDLQGWLDEKHRREVAGRRAERIHPGLDGCYSTPYQGLDWRDAHGNGVPALEADADTPGWADEDLTRELEGSVRKRIVPQDEGKYELPSGYKDRLDLHLDFRDLPC